VVGLSALVYAIVEGPERGWTSPAVAGAFAVAAVVLGLFAVVELRSAHPMLDVRLFANPAFGAASLALTAMFFCLTGVIFLQTLHLQFPLGYDPLAAGLRSAPASAVLLFVSPVTPRLVRAVGTRAVCFTGLSIGAVGVAARGNFSVHTRYDAIFISLCLFGLGIALTMAPATASIMGVVGQARAGVGSAVNDTTRQVGGALGVAVMGSVAASLYRHDLTRRLARSNLPTGVAAKATGSVGGALQLASHLPAASGGALAGAARHAFFHGADAACLAGAAVLALGAILAASFLPSGMRVGTPARGVSRSSAPLRETPADAQARKGYDSSAELPEPASEATSAAANRPVRTCPATPR
jgi:hypothetical protein